MLRHAVFSLLVLLSIMLVACSQPPPESPPQIVLAVQAQSTNHHGQIFAGEIRAREEMNMAFRVAGKIQQRSVDTGAHVRAGQVLARLDNQDLQLQNQASHAQMQAMKADRDLAAAELSRYRALAKQQLVAKSALDSKVAQAQATQSRYQQAIAQSSLNTNQSDYAVLRAPHDGVIVARDFEVGQVLQAGQRVFALAVDGPRDVLIHVAEQDVSQVHIGQTVWVELWAQPDQRFPATIREIAGAADEVTRTYALRVALNNVDTRIQLGQSARVLLDASLSQVLSVPLSAITELNNQMAVWVIDPNTARLHKRVVAVQRYTSDSAQISAGLKEGEWLVQAGVHLLREGQEVHAIDRDNRNVISRPAGHTP